MTIHIVFHMINRILLAALLTSVCSTPAAAADRPNILFIMSDDHSYQAMGIYGSRLAKLNPTPNLDRSPAPPWCFEVFVLRSLQHLPVRGPADRGHPRGAFGHLVEILHRQALQHRLGVIQLLSHELLTFSSVWVRAGRTTSTTPRAAGTKMMPRFFMSRSSPLEFGLRVCWLRQHAGNWFMQVQCQKFISSDASHYDLIVDSGDLGTEASADRMVDEYMNRHGDVE